MNPKIIKLKAERAKNDEKIAALQSRNRELDESIVELENNDIIGLARAHRHEHGGAGAVPHTAQKGRRALYHTHYQGGYGLCA